MCCGWPVKQDDTVVCEGFHQKDCPVANIKSAKKRIDIAERNRQRNVYFKSSVRTALKKVQALVKSAADQPTVTAAIGSAFSLIDRSVLKGVLHKNTAARLKSRLMGAIAS